MIRNYISVAIRNLLKHKFYSGLNILGLSVGVTCFLLIFLYVKHEISYDNFHSDIENIYRLDFEGSLNGNDFIGAVASPPAAAALVNDFPEFLEAIRFREKGDLLVKQKGETQTIKEDKGIYVDGNFFNFFSFNLIQGDPNTCLVAPNLIVLSESAALKYFGNENPIGKVLTIDNDADFEVTGVFEDFPSNSHFDFDVLLSLETLDEARQGFWLSFNFNTYFKVQPGTDPAAIEAKFPSIIEKYIGPEVERFLGGTMDQFYEAGNKIGFYLFPMKDIHLYSAKEGELGINGDIKYIYIFSAIASFILLIACINFMNLATARSSNRAKEVGIRKTMGAYRPQLIKQFLAEAIVLSLISFVLAFGLASAFFSGFNSLAGKDLLYSDLFGPNFVLLMFVVMVVVGLLAGSYPAFYLSGFRPVEVLKGKLNLGMKGGGLRSVLVVFQFTLSIIMIVGTAVVFDQLDYIQNKKLGFDKDHVLMVQDPWVMKDGLESFKNEVLRNPKVKSGTISSFIPASDSDNSTIFFPGNSPDENNTYVVSNWRVDYDYIETLGMKLVAGRNFSKDFQTDSLALIINETAANQFGFTDAIGETVSTYDGNSPEDIWVQPYKVIGVVEDFHATSMRDVIQPLVIYLGQSRGFISFKIQGDDINGTISTIQSKWDEFAPGQPFSYSFLDQKFDALYDNEQQVGKIFGIFSFLAIFIACLGLFGLAAFTAEQRTKEIGVRKVMGASISGIMGLLSKESMKLMFIAFVLASPLAYFAMDSWLQDFAFRTDIKVTTFLAAGILSFLVAWLTMSYNTLRAARTNPVNALRDE